jgi:hypothetical protein
MKNDEFLANLHANKDNLTYLSGLNKNKKENIKVINDLLNKYKSQLKDLTTPKLTKVFNESKINELKAVIGVLTDVLTKIT